MTNFNINKAKLKLVVLLFFIVKINIVTGNTVREYIPPEDRSKSFNKSVGVLYYADNTNKLFPICSVFAVTHNKSKRIITALHCFLDNNKALCNNKTGTLNFIDSNTKLMILFPNNGQTLLEVEKIRYLTDICVHESNNYKFNWTKDIALIDVKTLNLAKKNIPKGLAIQQDTFDLNNTNAYTLGYPGNCQLVSDITMINFTYRVIVNNLIKLSTNANNVISEISLTDTTIDNVNKLYKITGFYTDQGNSGGPLLKKDDGKIIGILSHAINTNKDAVFVKTSMIETIFSENLPKQSFKFNNDKEYDKNVMIKI